MVAAQPDADQIRRIIESERATLLSEVDRRLGLLRTSIAAQDDGAVISNDHRILNFQGPGVVVTDEPTRQRANVYIPGAPTATATTTIVSSTAAKAQTLWNGSSNDAPPAGWQTAGYSLAGKGAAVVASGTAPVPTAAARIAPAATPASTTEQFLIWDTITLPTGIIVTDASLQFNVAENMDGVYANGALVPGTSKADGALLPNVLTVPVPTGLLVGGANRLAAKVNNTPAGGTGGTQIVVVPNPSPGTGQNIATSGSPKDVTYTGTWPSSATKGEVGGHAYFNRGSWMGSLKLYVTIGGVEQLVVDSGTQTFDTAFPSWTADLPAGVPTTYRFVVHIASTTTADNVEVWAWGISPSDETWLAYRLSVTYALGGLDARYGLPLTIKEADGAPSGTPGTLILPNGTLTDNGNGSFTFTPAPGGAMATDPLWDALGDLAYGSGADTGAKLAGNTAATRKFLRQLGTGSVSAAPAWDTLAVGDLPVMVGDSGSGGTAGAVPAPGAGDAAAGKFLSASGGFAAPSAGAGGALTRIAQTIVGVGGVASVTFSSIPGGYTDLLLTWRARTDNAARQGLQMRWNGDTAANYDEVDAWIGVTANTIGSQMNLGVATLLLGWLPGSGGVAGMPGFGSCCMYAYASTAFNKAHGVDSGLRTNTANTTDTYRYLGQGTWRNTAAIVTILLYPAAGNFVQNSVFTLWGVS